MSDNTIHINTKGNPAHKYDAIVIGRGISSGVVTKKWPMAFTVSAVNYVVCLFKKNEC